MKNATMRDVAKLAGVSVATVSYVLNKTEKFSIPEETRKKVLEAAEELNYVFDLTARALSRKKSGLIGIFIMNRNNKSLPWTKFLYSEFIQSLVKNLYSFNYHVIIEYIESYEDKLNIIYERALDGVFLVNISEDHIYKITNIFKVPIILVDSCVEDTLFHKVISDNSIAVYKAKELLKEANPFILADSMNTKLLIEKFSSPEKSTTDKIFVPDSTESLYTFLNKNGNRKGIIFNEFLALLSKNHLNCDNIAVVCSSGNDYLLDFYRNKVFFDNKEKASTAVSIMLDYINKDYHKNKFTFIKPQIL